MVEEKSFGKLSDNTEVKLYTLKNSQGTQVSLSQYGACIVSIITADINGNFADIVLGFDDACGYENQKGSYMGATVGRHANRINGGKFMLLGKPVVLNCNDGKNHLHGGNFGFDKKVWNAQTTENSVIFTCVSEDNDENYPGRLEVTVIYTLSDTNSLTIDYTAVSDKTTVVNLTNHTYFNLKGHDAQNADTQMLRINADRFTGINTEVVPDGTIAFVEHTPMDFRNFERINSRIDFDYIQLRNAGGYDHNFVLNKRERNILSLAAELYDDESNRYLAIHTTKPGIQFYSGNFLDGSMQGKDSAIYTKRSGICLEPQYFPNAMEHTHFPSPILRAGETYHHITRYTFGAKKIKTNCD